MGKYNTSKQIGTFADFCKSKQKKSINENSEVSIEVPFWDDAIQLLLDKIHVIAGEPISWDRLVTYVKNKFIITGRDLIDDEDRLVIAYIIDALYQEYGESWADGNTLYTSSTADLGSKALVLSTLAEEIFHQAKQEAGKNTRSDGKSPKIRQEAKAPTCGRGSGPLGNAAGPAGGQPKWPGWRPGGIKSVAAFKGMAGLFGVLHLGPAIGDTAYSRRINHTRRLVERSFVRNSRHPFA